MVTVDVLCLFIQHDGKEISLKQNKSSSLAIRGSFQFVDTKGITTHTQTHCGWGSMLPLSLLGLPNVMNFCVALPYRPLLFPNTATPLAAPVRPHLGLP